MYACGRNDNGQLGLGEDLEEDHAPPLRHSRARKSMKPTPEKKPESEEAAIEEEHSKSQSPAQPFTQENPGELLNLNFIWEPRKLELKDIINIACGTHTSYAVGNERTAHQLYSWGLSENYILINGSSDNDKYTPYSVNNAVTQVLPKIINNEIVRDISASAQHVAYLATNNKDLEVKVDEGVFSKYSVCQCRHVSAKKGKIIGKIH